MRRLDWPERLIECVEAAKDQPFVWGQHDCALWACEIIAELIGTDPVESVRGTYTTAEEAVNVLQGLGGETLADVAAALAESNGFDSIPPALAQRGDLVLCPSGLESWPHSLGICMGIYAVMTGQAGLVRVPMADVEAAWRIV